MRSHIDSRVRLTIANREFLAAYASGYPQLQNAAELAQEITKDVLGGYAVKVDSVTARAKSVDSALGKLRVKKYRDPANDLTDAIGVRAITYYRDDLDVVIKKLSDEFTLDRKRSVDTRSPLGLRGYAKRKGPRSLGVKEFGYESVHLVVKLKGLRARTPEFSLLRGRWFEIQVRTLIEHAWAQVEHEVVYKSGIDHPPEITRRFSAAAATMELLDSEFLRLRDEQDKLIDSYVSRYQLGEDLTRKFDAARLVAYLEVARPYGLGWRQARKIGAPFRKGLDRLCVQVLHKTGLFSSIRLARVMDTSRFRRAIRTIAATKGIEEAIVRHPVIVAVAAAIANSEAIRNHFPEMSNDPDIAPIL